MYIEIYYRKMKITWVLTDFYDYEIEQLAKVILQSTQKTTFYKTKSAFICKTIKDVRKIYDILLQWYYNNCNYRESNNVFYDYSKLIEAIKNTPLQ